MHGEKLAEIRRTTIEMTRLVKSIPERFFGNDPRKIAAYYGIQNEELVAAVLAPPNGLDGALIRNDYFDTPDGFKCLEINAGQIGGWQVRDFEQRIRANPLIARFLQEEGLIPYYRDPLAMLLQYIITHNLEKPTTASGELNIAIILNNRYPMKQDAQLSRMYQHGEQGYTAHDVVWGTFCFGDLYSGGFLRMVPRGKGDGIINSARGASEGILFEV